MDIGSAKITKEEMQGIRHHMIDIIDPDSDFSVADFCTMTKENVADIKERGHLPIIVGGTGFYIRAFLYDTDFSDGESDPKIRKRLNDIAEREGADKLYEMLIEADSEYADSVHKNNIKRVIRALEYHELTGKKFSEYNEEESQKTSPYKYRHYCLTMPRDILYPRINERVDKMIKMGLLDEVKGLKAKGYGRDLKSMQAIGYKEMYDHIEGDISLEAAVDAIKKESRHFAKRQETWFKKEKNVTMIHVSKTDALKFISEDLKNE